MQKDKTLVIHDFPVWLPQTQTWMYNQIKHLPTYIEVHVVCDQTKNLDQFALPRMHVLKDVSQPKYLWQKGLRKLGVRVDNSFLYTTSMEIGCQIIHSHFGHIGWNDLLAAEKANCMHVITYYGADLSLLPKQNKKWLTRYEESFNKADLFLCEGPFMAQRLNELGCLQEKVKVHHLGVTVDSIPFRPRRWDPQSPLRILIAASFQEKKGIPFALDALKVLQDVIALEITIIGDATSESRSQKEKKYIFEIIQKNGMGSITRLLGYQPFSVLLREAYTHHVFLSPSVTAVDGDNEGGAPVSLIEMVASGMPVVSTRHCDIPEVVNYGMDGWLVEERSVEGLVSKLRWLIENSDRWDDFLTVGRRHVETEYNAVRQGERLASIYHQVLAS